MSVCGIDPGRTTGLVHCSNSGKILCAQAAREHKDIVEFLRQLDSETTVVVMEDFLGSGPRSADAIFTIKLLGFVEGCCHLMGLELIVQPPQWRKAFLDKAQMHFRVHKERHCKDALAHVYSYLERLGYDEWE